MQLNAENVSELTDDELFKVLKQCGMNVGPITSTTRFIYEKRLRAQLETCTEPIVVERSESGTETTSTETSTTTTTTATSAVTVAAAIESAQSEQRQQQPPAVERASTPAKRATTPSPATVSPMQFKLLTDDRVRTPPRNALNSSTHSDKSSKRGNDDNIDNNDEPSDQQHEDTEPTSAKSNEAPSSMLNLKYVLIVLVFTVAVYMAMMHLESNPTIGLLDDL